MVLVLIAIGGALGSVTRFLTVSILARQIGVPFPFGTLAVNVIGSFAMGVAVAILMDRTTGVSPAWSLGLTVGFLGGFTTFSAFSLDSYLLLESGRWTAFLTYASLSVIGSFAALVLGLLLTRWIAG